MPDADPLPISQPARSAPAADPALILVVNDREDQLLATTAMLEPLGHRVITATSGPEALRQLLHHDFAVMLLDVNMPDMDGYEIAKAVRQRPKLELTPIIFVTATNQTDIDLLRGYETGAADYVHVPIDPAILRAKVVAFVRMHRMHAEIRQQAKALAQLNWELQDQARQLAMVNQELEAFSYSVSHDLRAPLRIIDQFSALLVEEQGNRLDDAGRARLERIRSNTARMSRLIEDLLELSRISRTPIAPGDVDITALAQTVVADLRQQDPQRQVEVDIAPGMVAKADRGLVRTLLENLLGNAWKYSGRQAAPRISVGVGPTVHHPRTFHVADNGVGFDMAYAGKLFTPFQRLHTEADFPGTGIGLSIVARVVARHGGHIWAESSIGQGAIFYFALEPGNAGAKK